MTIRTDIIVDFNVSPRIITVLQPSTEVILQDLVDTLRDIEDNIANMSYPRLIDASGKEPLGGGVTVGITAELQNAQLSFEARTTPASSGIADVAFPPSGPTLEDAAATFVTDNIVRGSTVVNNTDGSVGDVLFVEGETTLQVTALVGGVDNGFDTGDSYDIYNIIQCNVSGGNLVAVDDVDAELDPILPTGFTQVIRTSSSSATLQELETLQFSSYNGVVTVDVGSVYSGTTFPIGTLQEPVNNFSDALSIASARGFNTISVLGSATITGVLDFTNFIFKGQGETQTILTLDSSAILNNCVFKDATITGTLDGNSTITFCELDSLNFINGVVDHCILLPGTHVLGGSATANFITCFSGVPGTSTPILDCGGDGPPLSIRDYNGGIELRNKTGSDSVSIDLNSGHVILDSTVTDGTIVIRGVGQVTDNSTGTTTVLMDSLINNASIADQVWDETMADHTTAGTTGEALDGAGGAGTSPAAIADAVWEEALADHTTDTTFGGFVQLLLKFRTWIGLK